MGGACASPFNKVQQTSSSGSASGRARSSAVQLLRCLVEVGLLSLVGLPQQPLRARSARVPNTYRLHLPPVRPRDATAGRRCSALAVPCRWTATLRPALPPMCAPGAPGPPAAPTPTPRPDHPCLPGRAGGAAAGVCFRATTRSLPRPSAPGARSLRALKVLEWAGVLTWQNRIMRSQERRTDLFGCVSWRWRVIRTSNASVFRDLLHGSDSVLSCKAENRSGTRNQEILEPILAPAPDPRQPARTCLSPIRRCIQQHTRST